MQKNKTLTLIVILTFLVIIGILFKLQIKDYSHYRFLSEDNFLRIIPYQAPRGSIMDSQGRILAEDKEIFNCALFPQEIKDKRAVFKELSSLLGWDMEKLEKMYKRNYQFKFLPVVIKNDLSEEEFFILKSQERFLKGVKVLKGYKRIYSQDPEFSTLLGYTGYITKKRFKIFKEYGLLVPERVGRYGLEEIYDGYLRGRMGAEQVVVDALSRKIKTLSFFEPLRGKDIRLSINKDLQSLGYSVLRGKAGVIILGKINGEILCLVSSPGFEAQKFIDGDKDYIRSVLRAKTPRLINRTIQGLYPPGSIFKLLVALASLEEKKITLHKTFYCRGEIEVGDRVFKCWSRHGKQDVISGIMNSCNVFFYRAGLLLGASKVMKYARRLELDEETGLLPGEKKGFLPSPSWKRHTLGGFWSDGDTCNLSIGQGWILLNPLQVYKFISFIASGYLIKPYLVKNIGGINVEEKRIIPAGFNPKNLEIVSRGMRLAVKDPRGTAHALKEVGLGICAKTATAQTRGRAHAWVVGFFPFRNPQYVFVVLLEHGGSSHNACILARDFLREIKERRLLSLKGD